MNDENNKVYPKNILIMDSFNKDIVFKNQKNTKFIDLINNTVVHNILQKDNAIKTDFNNCWSLLKFVQRNKTNTIIKNDSNKIIFPYLTNKYEKRLILPSSFKIKFRYINHEKASLRLANLQGSFFTINLDYLDLNSKDIILISYESNKISIYLNNELVKKDDFFMEENKCYFSFRLPKESYIQFNDFEVYTEKELISIIYSNTESNNIYERYHNKINFLEEKVNYLSEKNKLISEQLISKKDIETGYLDLSEKYQKSEKINNLLIEEINNELEKYAKLIYSNVTIDESKINKFYQKNYHFYKNLSNEFNDKNSDNNRLLNMLIENKINDSKKIQDYIENEMMLIEHEHKNQLYKEKFNALSKINIAYVLGGFPTLSQTFVMNELKWLKEKGFNVKVFCYKNPEKPFYPNFYLDIIHFDFSKDYAKNLEHLLIKHKIHLMHTHFVYPVATTLTYPIAKKLKIPFTVFAHAYDIFTKDNDERNNITEISNSPYCKAIFTLSEYHKQYLMERNVPENKIILTKQATTYNIAKISKKEFNPTKKIISISRFVEKKGLDTLIKCAAILKDEDMEFSIYGFGILEDKLKQEIDNLNLTNISLKGSLNGYNEVVKAFKESDLLVSPCKIAENGDRDGFPTVIFEAMAEGIPVLTTNVSAIPEIIKDNENGFIVSPDNPEELANKIREIFKLSSEKIYDIKLKAQQDVLENTGVDKTMETVISTWLK